MVCIWKHYKLVHVMGVGHVMPPEARIVVIEELIIPTIDHEFWHNKLIPEGVRVDDIGKFCKLWMVKVVGQIEFPVRLEGEGPSSIRSEMMFDVGLEVE